MPAVLFGSISTLADTSELQRQAFNEAFAAEGLDWTWSREEYAAQLTTSGGKDRVAAYAASRGEKVDAGAVHRAKSALFQKSLETAALTPRPGVVETIHAARAGGYRIGFVTTTSPENVSALLSALEPEVSTADFDLIVDSSTVAEPKPDKAAYAYALTTLAQDAKDCIAIEDNLGGVTAATAAGVTCVAFPNANTAAHDFGRSTPTVDHLDFAELAALV